MRKHILLVLGAFTIVSCSKSSESKSNSTTETEYGANYTERVETYKGTDGTPVKVIFTQSDKNNFITFENNGTRIQVFETGKEENGKIYENNNLNVRVNGDSIILRQNGQIVEMVRE